MLIAERNPLGSVGTVGSGQTDRLTSPEGVSQFEVLPPMDAHAVSVLAATLEAGARRMWPRRKQVELLFDLGERKGWGDAEVTEACARAAGFLHDELGLRPRQDPPPMVRSDAVLTWARASGAVVWQGPAPSGVAKWSAALAPGLGVQPKTLANSVVTGLSEARSDHRWLAALARCAEQEAASDAWVFHRRTPGAVSRELGRLNGPGCLDAGDALLLFSLLALWQRRRPTERARGNRRQAQPRRATPKPIVALEGQLLQPGQVDPLLTWADRIGAGGEGLKLLAIEAVLTEAHLAPHLSRVGAAAPADGAHWLAVVDSVAPLLGPAHHLDAAAFRYRAERQRSFALGASLPEPPAGLADLPYMRACASLKAFRAGHPVPLDCPRDAPGVLMMLPQLRSRGLVE